MQGPAEFNPLSMLAEVAAEKLYSDSLMQTRDVSQQVSGTLTLFLMQWFYFFSIKLLSSLSNQFIYK